MSGSFDKTSSLQRTLSSKSRSIARSRTDGSIHTAVLPESLQTRSTDPTDLSTITSRGRALPTRPPREGDLAEDDEKLISWQRALKEGATIDPDPEPTRKKSIPLADKIMRKIDKLRKKARGGNPSPQNSPERTLDGSEPSAHQEQSEASKIEPGQKSFRESTVLGEFPNYAGSDSDQRSTPEASDTPVRTLDQSREQTGAAEVDGPGEKATIEPNEPKRLSYYAQRDDDDSDAESAVLGQHPNYAEDTSGSESDDNDDRRLLDRSQRRRRRDSSPSAGTIKVAFPLHNGKLEVVLSNRSESPSQPAPVTAGSSRQHPTAQQNPAVDPGREKAGTQSSPRPQKQGGFREAYSKNIPSYGPRR